MMEDCSSGSWRPREDSLFVSEARTEKEPNPRHRKQAAAREFDLLAGGYFNQQYIVIILILNNPDASWV
jgi:hypothetical protein